MITPYNDPRISSDFKLIPGEVYGYKGTIKKQLDYIELAATTTIVTLEEIIDGVSTNVFAQHNLTAGAASPAAGYVLKSKYGHGFSKIEIGVAGAQGYVLDKNTRSNNKDSVESGINKIG